MPGGGAQAKLADNPFKRTGSKQVQSGGWTVADLVECCIKTLAQCVAHPGASRAHPGIRVARQVPYDHRVAMLCQVLLPLLSIALVGKVTAATRLDLILPEDTFLQ